MNGRYGAIRLLRLDVGTPLTETIVGLAVLAVAIIGLAGIFPWSLASVAAIALGAAFVFESGAIGKRFSMLADEAWGGITIGFLAGCAGVALGILSILGIDTTLLIPVALTAYGVALLMDSRTRFVLSEMENEHAGLQGMSLKAARESARVSASIQVLAALAAMALGILAIMKYFPATLSLAGLLGVGATVVFFSSPIGGFFRLR